jgi:hypothetical protein
VPCTRRSRRRMRCCKARGGTRRWRRSGDTGGDLGSSRCCTPGSDGLCLSRYEQVLREKEDLASKLDLSGGSVEQKYQVRH